MIDKEINDDIIIDTFFINNKYNHSRLRQSWLNKNSQIYNYLLNRYNDSDSLQETIYRIKYNIEIRPVCKYCGGHVKFNKYQKKLFNTYCSSHCANLDPDIQIKKIEESNKKYGIGNYNNRKKCKETCLKKYGVDNIAKSDISKKSYIKTCLEKYGVKNTYQIPEVIDKIKIKNKETCIAKYGVDNVAKVSSIKEKIYKSREINNLIKYGVKYTKQLDWVKEKEYITKRKNHTFNTSKTETESYKLLKEKYPDVLYQYKSDVYPFACDFYIPSLDTYIECNYHWTHGGHPYDSNNINDYNKLKLWKSKNTKFYDNAINCWTIRDVKKRNIAKQNNLNYLEFWNINELKEWIYENSK